jgi:hypothetical protein
LFAAKSLSTTIIVRFRTPGQLANRMPSGIVIVQYVTIIKFSATMWQPHAEELANGCITKVYLKDRPVTFVETLVGWQHDALFRKFFTGLLADAPYSAFRWETPPITTASATRPFEFALINSPELEVEPDPDAFAEHFTAGARDDVVSFTNLNHDAILVVPAPIDRPSIYVHLGAFVRNAPESQQHALWRLVGWVTESQLGTKPIWISTAGAGVPWLHVRIDSRPKYYRHTPYREDSFGK